MRFLLWKDEVRSSTDDWSAMGMRGNQSSPVVCEGILTADRLVGSFGELLKENVVNRFTLEAASNDE